MYYKVNLQRHCEFELIDSLIKSLKSSLLEYCLTNARNIAGDTVVLTIL